MNGETSTGPFAIIAKLAADAGMSMDDFVYLARRAYVMEHLDRAKGNRCVAARAMGKHRNTLLRSIDKFSLPTKKGPWKENNPHVRHNQRSA